MSLHLFHHPQEVLLAQFSLYVHKGGLNPIDLLSFRRVDLTSGRAYDNNPTFSNIVLSLTTHVKRRDLSEA